MIDVSLDELEKYLQTHDLKMNLEHDTQQLHSIIKLGGFEYPLFIRPYEGAPLLQLLLFLPVQIKKECEASVGRLMHLVNREMDIPGFGMDEENAVIFYRMMLFTIDNQVDERQIALFLSSLEKIIRAFTLPLMAVAQGRLSYEEVVKKLKGNKGQI